MAEFPIKPRGDGSAQRRRYSISTVLMVGFGCLIFLGMAGVYTIATWSSRENAFGLLTDRIELTTSALADDLRRRLEPVRAGGAYIADQVARGEFNPADQLETADRFTSAMTVTPQILGMAFISADIEVVRVRRGRGGLTVHIADESGRADLRRTVDDARNRAGAYWGRLAWSADSESAMIDLRTPLRRNGKFLGMLVSVASVSKLLAPMPGSSADDPAPTRFVLYGKNHVLAHDGGASGEFRQSARRPLPRLDQIGDPVLARLWDPDSRRELSLEFTGRARGHVIEYQGDAFPVFYLTLAGYGKTPMIVGAYIRPGARQGAATQPLGRAAIAVGVALLLVVMLALVLGRRISRPVRDLATAARRIGELDFSREIHFKNTRLRELDDAAGAFNAMMTGLRWFETYVPRALARRIVKAGGDARVEASEQDVTVMFTDIARFAGLAENLTATETADLLNGHFSLLAQCIEAEDGTLDKFIGDSVMAFWAPPLGSSDHIARACRAALAIRGAVAGDNRARAARGDDPIRVRIGIHAGRAIVGNIGAPGRINYTVLGDTVKLAQRLEELGKTTWGAGEDAIILVSGDVADALGDDFDLTPRGSQEIRGREGRLRVFRLEPGKLDAPEPTADTTAEPRREPAKPPKQPARREADPETSRETSPPKRAYNPAVQPPKPNVAFPIASTPVSDGPKSMSPRPKTAPTPPVRVATPHPVDNDEAVAPPVAPPGSPAAARYGAKDPKGYKFDWDVESLEIGKPEDDDPPSK